MFFGFITCGASGKETVAKIGDLRDSTDGFDPWVVKIPWTRKGQPIPVFLPGESHGQSKLVGYNLQGRKELGITEAN